MRSSFTVNEVNVTEFDETFDNPLTAEQLTDFGFRIFITESTVQEYETNSNGNIN